VNKLTGVFIGQWEPDTDEWLEARLNRLGGSEIAVACGWSPYDTRDELMQRKVGLLPRQEITDAMLRGKLCEDAVLAWLDQKHGLNATVQHPGTFVHPANNRWLYNPDGIRTNADGDLILLEAKTVSDRSVDSGWGRAGSDKIPIYYQCQVMWGMGILGLDVCHVGVLHGATNGRPDLGFATYTVAFKQELFDLLAERADVFLNDLDALRERSAA